MNGGVHIYAERVADALDTNVLLEAVVGAILGDKPDVTFAVSHLVLRGRVVGYVSVRGVFDVLDHAVEDFRDLGVCAVVCGDDFT